MYVERAGESGPQVLLVHGSIVPGWQTWNAQRPLADHLRLVIPHRTGYPPNPPLERIDIQAQAAEIAALIEPGMHVVGHSYGGIVSLVAAALVPDRIRSLAVIEPPAFGLARGNPAVEDIVAEIAAVYADTELSPREFFLHFAGTVGATPSLPDPLPPQMVAAAHATRIEQPPWEAQIPFDVLADARFPKLVFTGDHNAAFDAVADVLAVRLPAERTVIQGSGHSVQRTGDPFNTRLRDFILTAEPPPLRA
jgi:pimeloyl-ACP methyl ester carboxylesterase